MTGLGLVSSNLWSTWGSNGESMVTLSSDCVGLVGDEMK